jgi:glycine/D-amino acid oxidase-like deaminating enzyme/nitrite reductase/ring-hydroxylating ferredoxin subunit
MKTYDGRTQSIWRVGVEVPTYPPLASDTSTDVCVVGAGIAGLTTAYLLAREGRSVIVLNDGAIGDGQTGRTSAHLTAAIDDRFFHIREMHGERVAQLHYQSHAHAIDTIEQIARTEKIDCDLARIDGYLFLDPGDSRRTLDQELAASQLAGVAGVELLDTAPAGAAFKTGPCLRFPCQGRFHPMKYLAGLCRAIERHGGRICCGNRVTDVQGGDLSKNELCRATTQEGAAVSARAVVVATNTPAPINDWAGIYTKQASYRTYLIGVAIPEGAVTDALYWDTGEQVPGRRLRPYHYIRLVPSTGDGRDTTLLVGGEDHKTGQFEDGSAPFLTLERWTREHFALTGDVRFRWSGQVQEPVDALAFIGRAPTAKPNIYVITGDSGMGLTHSTLGAILISDLIAGRNNAWQEIYDPSRKMTASVGEFVKENANAVATFVDYVTGGDVSSVEAIRPGTGAILRDGLKKLAVYRDDAGQLTKLSCACTHLGCVVQWNHVEGTWDCPCHGSRFDATGKVVMGPAITDLKRVE